MPIRRNWLTGLKSTQPKRSFKLGRIYANLSVIENWTYREKSQRAFRRYYVARLMACLLKQENISLIHVHSSNSALLENPILFL